MPKGPTLSDLANLDSPTVVNSNSDAIEAAFENTISRDGSTPNQMLADLDMNSNRILNVGQAIQAGDAVSLGQIAALTSSGELAFNGFVQDSVTVTEGQTDVDLASLIPSYTPGDGNLIVFIDGVLQGSGFTVNTDGTITFDTPLTAGQEVSVILLNTSNVAAVATAIYDVAFTYQGTPSESAELVVALPRACELVAGAPNSVAIAEVAATASAEFDLQRNGSSIGTVTFAAAATTGSISVASTTSFSAGDRISLTAPSSQDDTLADVGITFVLRLP